MGIARRATLMLLALAASPAWCAAQTCTWIGPTTGSWIEPTYWDTGIIPDGPTFIAVVGTSSNLTISSDITLADLRIQNPAAKVIINQPRVLTLAGGTMTSDGLLRLGASTNARALLLLSKDTAFASPSATGQIEIGGSTNATGPGIDASTHSLTNQAGHRIFGAGAIKAGVLNNNGLIESWVSQRMLAVTAQTVINQGAIRAQRFAPLTLTATKLLDNSGIIEAVDADVTVTAKTIQQSPEARFQAAHGRIVQLTADSITGGSLIAQDDGTIGIAAGNHETLITDVHVEGHMRTSGKVAIDVDVIGPEWHLELFGTLTFLKPCLLTSPTLLMDSSSAKLAGEALTIAPGATLLAGGTLSADVINLGTIEAHGQARGTEKLLYNKNLIRIPPGGEMSSLGSIIQDEQAVILVDEGTLDVRLISGGHIIAGENGGLLSSTSFTGNATLSGRYTIVFGGVGFEQPESHCSAEITLRGHPYYGPSTLGFSGITTCQGLRIIMPHPTWDDFPESGVYCNPHTTFASDCIIEGQGWIIGNAVNHGLLLPYALTEPAIHIDQGTLTQAADSTTELSLAASGPGADPRIAGSGFIAGGLLRIVADERVEPGMAIDIVACNVISGRFDALDCRRFTDGGPGYHISYTARLITLHARLCTADFDGSGTVDPDDMPAFLAAFIEGDLNADADGSGFVDTDDFDAFIHATEAGC